MSFSNSICALALHGGAGNLSPQNLPLDDENAARAVLLETLEKGHQKLKNGARSLDVVEFAVEMLENSPLFNAGRGASLTHEGRAELDASIMDGRTLQAGAVAGVTTICNPIRAARAVLEDSPYVLLIGQGADDFAREKGLEIVENSYFQTEKQRRKWEELRQSQSVSPPKSGEKFGTVGAVALDKNGDLAAATSTGGMMNKRFGRVGDSPIIGAGTYANNATCAVSATGHGEHFLCSVAAYDISARMEYSGFSVQKASETVVLEKLAARQGDGGVIAIDKNGEIAVVFNTIGMFRAHIGVDGRAQVRIFRE